MWNLDRPEVAKVISFQAYLEIPTRPSRKLRLWILVSWSELTLSYYYRTLNPENRWFYSLHWLQLFRQEFHWQLFSLSFAFFWNNCCLFFLSFLCRFDGDYRSKTAPLVVLSTVYNSPKIKNRKKNNFERKFSESWVFRYQTIKIFQSYL